MQPCSFGACRIGTDNFETVREAMIHMHNAAQHDSTFGPKVLGFIRPIAATFEVDLGVVLDVADVRPRPRPLLA